MARPPSLRRPALQIMAREMRRIERKQLDAEKHGEEYALTADEREAVESAAKVAAVLEKLKGDDADEADAKAKPDADETPEQRLRRLEEKTPARVGRGTPDADDDA